MCGIVGFLDTTHNAHAAVGSVLFAMLQALGCRGPDSAGVALYGSGHAGDLVLQIKLGEGGDFEAKSQEIVARVQRLGTLRDRSRTAEYLRLVLSNADDPRQVERLIEADDDHVEVVSMGRHLEIVKQVGSPQSLDATYGVSKWTGTHGLGHTRLSTESRIDLSHSQPFWAHGSVSPQKSGAKSPSLSGLSREREADIMACHTSHVSPLEPATLCSKIWTYTASRMNRHANSSGGCSTCSKT